MNWLARLDSALAWLMPSTRDNQLSQSGAEAPPSLPRLLSLFDRIGKKFCYDDRGGTVMMTSRMESTGSAGRTQTCDERFRALGNALRYESGGSKQTKGRGMIKSWWLVGMS